MMNMATSLPRVTVPMATLLSEGMSYGKNTLVLSGRKTKWHLKLRG